MRRLVTADEGSTEWGLLLGERASEIQADVESAIGGWRSYFRVYRDSLALLYYHAVIESQRLAAFAETASLDDIERVLNSPTYEY